MNYKNKIRRFFALFVLVFKIIGWFFTRPKSQGAIALIFYGDSILLIRKALFKKVWSLPGGNSVKDEESEQTAIRETQEEAGIEIKIIKKLGEYFENKYWRNHTTHVFLAEALGAKITIDDLEIEEAKFFDRKNLPVNKGQSLKKALEFYELQNLFQK
ncbi:MAG TPA: NUDIX hydrolase [Candidatus Paceibacterota bacterium]|nr:NUDIX hydrolase [Candidatus Paceibacterota bacterium]